MGDLDVELLGAILGNNADKHVQKISDKVENLARE